VVGVAEGVGAGGASSRCYVDVAAVRIQQWLARTPSLKGWRGASALLSQRTARASWERRLPAGVEWNDEAGDLDGVVSLRSVPGLSREDARQSVAAAGREVVAGLRAAMPALMLQTSTAWATSYSEAYEVFDRHRDTGEVPVVSLPAPAQVVLAKPCDLCRADPATSSVPGEDESARERQVCPDCAARYEAAGATASRREAMTPRAQQRLGAALAARVGRSLRFPPDFQGLSQAGPGRTPQLALVYADGNRVGAFLHAAAQHSRAHGSPAKADIVAAIDTACLQAVVEAVTAVGAAEVVPVVPHVAGGDDVLMSVPAGYGWPFTLALLHAFEAELDRRTAGWPEPVRTALPSMSAGLVFHHRSNPFPDMVRLAGAMLKQAKRHTRGQAAALALLDVTADGGAPPASRRPATVAELNRNSERLGRLAALPAAARATLLGLLRIAEYQDEHPEAVRDGESAAQALARRVVDSGAAVLWQTVLDRPLSGGTLELSSAEGAAVRAAVTGNLAARSRLRSTLDMARWWPPTPARRADAVEGRRAGVVPAARRRV
jgi:hypothetical protein